MREDFSKSLNQLSFDNSKHYLLHVSLIDLGLFKDLKPDKLCHFILSSLKRKTPKNSTFYTLSPFYDYSNRKENFNLSSKNVSKEVGSFAKYLISLKKSKRSNNPIFNLCANGPASNKIFSNTSTSSFGFDSAWHRLFDKNCEMIFIGCDLSKCTFIRFIEFNFGVPYIFNKYFSFPIKKNKTKINNFSISQLRYLNAKIEYKTIKFEELLIKKKLLIKSENKNISIMKIKMKDAFKVGVEELSKNPFYFLKGKPKFTKQFKPYN